MIPEFIVPAFIMDPLLRQEAEALVKFDLKYKFATMTELGLLPEALKKGPNFEERLRAKVDID